MRTSRPKTFSVEYQTYMRSAAWQQKRREAIESAGYRCERCAAEGTLLSLDVHHLTYENLGDETLDELQVCCRPCHVKADRERQAAVREDQYQRRLDGWASKKYGDDWVDNEDPDEVAEEFDEWLERRR